MKLRQDQLASHLANNLAPIYWISGDVPLLLQESTDAVRSAAKRHGFSNRQIIDASSTMNWSVLQSVSQSMSLFDEKEVIELRLKDSKFKDAGRKALLAYAENPPEDKLLLITSNKIAAPQLKTKWMQTLEKSSVFLQLWPLQGYQLNRFLQERAQQLDLQLPSDAIELIAAKTEGNLLAAKQELEKLKLLFGSKSVTLTEVTPAITDSSHFDIFIFSETALSGDIAKSIQILQSLKNEGCEAILILWSLTREIRRLIQIKETINLGNPIAQAMQKHGVWQKQQPAISSALNRHPQSTLHKLLQQAAYIDQMIKGLIQKDPWDGLLQLTTNLAGNKQYV